MRLSRSKSRQGELLSRLKQAPVAFSLALPQEDASCRVFTIDPSKIQSPSNAHRAAPCSTQGTGVFMVAKVVSMPH